MLVHAYSSERTPDNLSEDELVQRLSDNCPWITSLQIGGHHFYRGRFGDIVSALSRNTRVNLVRLDLTFFNEETVLALVKWLGSRGDKCGLVLRVAVFGRCRQREVERMLSILSSSQTTINIKDLHFEGDRVLAAMSPAFMINLLSLLSNNSTLHIYGRSTGEFLVPHLHLIASVRSLRVDPSCDLDSIPRRYGSLFSLPSIRILDIPIVDWHDLEGVIDCLNLYHSQDDGATLNELFLDFVQRRVPIRQVLTSLARIPPRISIDISMSDPDRELNVEAAETYYVSVPGLRSIRFRHSGETESRWITGLGEVLHRGRLQDFRLETTSFQAHHCLEAFRSCNLETFHLSFERALQFPSLDVLQKIADVVPTMNRLKDFRVRWPYLGAYERGLPQMIRNKVDHDHVRTSDTYVALLPTFNAIDKLVEAVCQSPSIVKYSIPNLSRWQHDRLCYAIKARLIRVDTLLLSTSCTEGTTPISLLPLALSTLSMGHWYDLMAYIVRQKSDQLIVSTFTNTPEPVCT